MKLIRFLAFGMMLNSGFALVGCSGGVTTTATPAVSGLGVITVTSVSPNSAHFGQALNVTITGSNFETGATVTADPGIDVSTVTVSSNTRITARFALNDDATLGAHRITVTNPNGFSTGCIDCFLIQP